MGLVGLAFSGGGIRSATFNLGVLQALAERKVLRTVDYLSTVSGGGYIGSWLISWIHKIGVHKVEQSLSTTDSPYPQQDEVQPIEFLRDFSNYLAPRPGMFSADTWTILAVWSRNTFLNLLILVSAISCVLLLPAHPRLRGQMAVVHSPAHQYFPGISSVAALRDSAACARRSVHR